MATKWSKYDKLWLCFSILLIICASIYKFLFIVDETSNLIIEVISSVLAVFGVTYVFGIAKQTRIAYFFGIGNVILYAIVCQTKGLYLSSLYNLFYSFPIMVYGYINWGRTKSNEEFNVKSFSKRQRGFLVVGMIFAVGIFAFISNKLFNGSNVILDSVVSVSVCVATFLMAKKYIEQWVLFIIANFFGVIMFVAINFNNMHDVELLLMWSIYLINSIYGMFAWRKTLNKKD